MEALDTLSPVHRITVTQFHQAVAAGMFADGDRVELIDGEMRDMPPIGPLHSSSTDELTMAFAPPLAGRAIVRVQGALVIDEGTELYPDLMVLRLREDHYRESHPTGDDVLLVIEVADSSLELDRQVKLPKYARAGIRQYWIVDLQNGAVHAYRDPDRFGGRYRQLQTVSVGRLGVAVAGVDVAVDVGALLGA
jgi:Uma2 family endonuclease